MTLSAAETQTEAPKGTDMGISVVVSPEIATREMVLDAVHKARNLNSEQVESLSEDMCEQLLVGSTLPFDVSKMPWPFTNRRERVTFWNRAMDSFVKAHGDHIYVSIVHPPVASDPDEVADLLFRVGIERHQYLEHVKRWDLTTSEAPEHGGFGMGLDLNRVDDIRNGITLIARREDGEIVASARVIFLRNDDYVDVTNTALEKMGSEYRMPATEEMFEKLETSENLTSEEQKVLWYFLERTELLGFRESGLNANRKGDFPHLQLLRLASTIADDQAFVIERSVPHSILKNSLHGTKDEMFLPMHNLIAQLTVHAAIGNMVADRGEKCVLQTDGDYLPVLESIYGDAVEALWASPQEKFADNRSEMEVEDCHTVILDFPTAWKSMTSKMQEFFHKLGGSILPESLKKLLQRKSQAIQEYRDAS